MADISAELAAIKSAVYGEEVRDSIHDGLQKMNNDLNTAIGTQVIDRASVDSIIESTVGTVESTLFFSDAYDVKQFDSTMYINTKEAFEQGNFTSNNPSVDNPYTVRTVGYITGGVYIVNSGQRVQWTIAEFTSSNVFVKYVAGSVPSADANQYKDALFYLPVSSTTGNKYRIRARWTETSKLITPEQNPLRIYAASDKFIRIASYFRADVSYPIGWYVWKENKLYKFTKAHSGSWLGTDVEEVDTISGDLARSFMFRGTNVADGGTSLSADVYMLQGMYRWNTAHQPSDIPSGETGPGSLWNFGQNNSTSIFTQIVVMNNSARMYYRQQYATNTWTAWKRFITSDDQSDAVYGYSRNYNEISGLLVWENKTIGTISGIADSSTRLIASLPNAGNVEVKMNTPNSQFVIVQEDDQGIFSYLTTPTWSSYFFRYTGNPQYKYYVMTRMKTSGNEINITPDYGPLNVTVYTYNDAGTVYNTRNPWHGKKIAVIGDSIVQGRFRKNASSGTNSTASKPFAVLIAERSNTEPGNYGIGGAPVYGSSDWRSLQSNAANVSGYDIVLVCAGTNDFGGNVSEANFKTAYAAVLRTLKSNNTRVIAITPTARSTNTTNTLGLKLSDYAGFIRTVSASSNVGVIDINTMTTNNTEWIRNLSDGLHPNETGQMMIADLILSNAT